MTEKKTIKIDFCDFWTSFNKENNQIYNELKKHYRIEISDNPDFLFYSCFGGKHLNYQNVTKIFFTGENILPNFNECDYASSFDYIDFGDRHFRKCYMVPDKNIQDRSKVSDDFFNRKFCNFIYSNGLSGEGSILRQEFCKKLMEYKPIDCPGKILNNMSAKDLEPRNGNWEESKINFLKNYKFTIAFENSSSNGYTTEKLYQPLQAFSIPIYWGNPLVTRDFNPKAFINCNDFDNDFDAVIERIKEIDNNPDLYLAMLRESPMQKDFDFDQEKKFEQWLINIIEKGNKPFNKDPRDWQGLSLKLSIKKLEEQNKQKGIEISKLKNTLNDIAKIKPYPMPKKKKRGNWLKKTIEKKGYKKTYILGIRIKKEPINMCNFINAQLLELEKRLTAKIKNN